MTLNIDELLLENDLSDTITDQVATIFESHGKIFPLEYALSWVVANQVVQRYYGSHGLDAVPIWRENFGWAQINLTRAENCFLPLDISAEVQRYIVFDAIAINWRNRYGDREIQYDVLTALQIQKQTPLMAINGAVQHLGLESERSGDHSACLHSRHAYTYTKFFDAITNLICQSPEMVVKRELAVDLDGYGKPVAQAVHPLRRVALVEPGLHRDWFQILYVPANRSLFVNVFTGDMCYTQSDDTPRLLDYPGWNELNEEQLTTYLGGILEVPETRMRL